MTSPLRVLITGFGPFPGAPFNPTPAIVDRLMRIRRPALADVERIAHIFPVTYAAVDRQLPDLIVRHRPDALLMFGLAARTSHIRIETRARNAISLLWPDATGIGSRRRHTIVQGRSAQMFGPHTHRLWRAALTTSADVRLSRDAGRYLCNYLSWRAIEASRLPDGPRLTAFIHVPLVARSNGSHLMQLGTIARAAEAVLMTLTQLTRAKIRQSNLKGGI